MREFIKKGGVVFGVVLLILLGFCAGFELKNYVHTKSVAIRIGASEDYVDYDMQTAINFLGNKLKQDGYFIKGISYGGNMYPEELNDVGVNIFVHGFTPIFDERMDDEALNVVYLHRNTGFYAEEMRNFDIYLSSQKSILASLDETDDRRFLFGGAVEHAALEPQYAYDVLYIYEFSTNEYFQFLQQFKHKVYSGVAFALLSDEEKRQELARARLVVYISEVSDKDDDNYVPYAVYDIISYGRPVLTAYNHALEKMVGNSVYFYDNEKGKQLMTSFALSQSDEEREKKALNARDKLFKNQEKKFSLRKK